MPYDPTDPGPVLDTWDPDWEARFDAAHRELERLQAFRNPRRDRDLRGQALDEMIAAIHAQFRYGWELDAFLREHRCLKPSPEDPPDLRAPSPPHTASRTEMEAHYDRWNAHLKEQRFLAGLPPPVEWEDGVFAETLPDGVTREVRDTSLELPWRRVPAHMRLVVERHPGVTHVCVIQRPGAGSGIVNDAVLRDRVAAQYLPRPGLLARLGYRAPRMVFHHTFRPTPNWPPGQPVWRSAMRWGIRGPRVDELEMRQATPFLREQAIGFKPV